jgi:hypothetical protein
MLRDEVISPFFLTLFTFIGWLCCVDNRVPNEIVRGGIKQMKPKIVALRVYSGLVECSMFVLVLLPFAGVLVAYSYLVSSLFGAL